MRGLHHTTRIKPHSSEISGLVGDAIRCIAPTQGGRLEMLYTNRHAIEEELHVIRVGKHEDSDIVGGVMHPVVGYVHKVPKDLWTIRR